MNENNDGLTRAVHTVRSIGLGDSTAFDSGALVVAPGDIEAAVRDPAIASFKVSVVSPGESARIVKVLDCAEPRTKGPGGGGIFPGHLGPPAPRGRGVTHVLRGAAVVAAGYLPRAQEALVDMSGPAAELSPLAQTHNLVIEFQPADGAPWEPVELAVRKAVLKAASMLAEVALESEPDSEEWLPHPSGARSGLPRVGTITNLQTQGAFKDVFVYGRSYADGLPTPIDPNELEDGAVVSGQYGHPGLKNPTWMFQNHPVVAALRARDGKDLEFGGLVISPEPVEQGRKELVAAHAARVCRALGFDAVVLTKEGGGNADADVSLKMDALENAGISAVGIFAEMTGPDGTGPPLVAPPEKAAAIVSSGNYDERIRLPAVDWALGGDRLDVAGADAGAEVEIPTAIIYCSLSPIGWGRLTAAPPPAEA